MNLSMILKIFLFFKVFEVGDFYKKNSYIKHGVLLKIRVFGPSIDIRCSKIPNYDINPRSHTQFHYPWTEVNLVFRNINQL